MATLVLVMLMLAMAGHSDSANWCICKEGVSDAVLQKTLDYACGAGGDCSATHQNGACYNPNTVRAHCNYAVNSYFQKKGQAALSCDFAGTATVVTSDPSTAGCVFPASASATTTNPGTTSTPNSTPTVNNTPTGTSPLITTPTGAAGGVGGVGGGINNGLGPSGNGINTDNVGNGGISLLKKKNIPTTLCSSFITIVLFSGLGLWWA